jgi:hypothetical protein
MYVSGTLDFFDNYHIFSEGGNEMIDKTKQKIDALLEVT